MPPVVIAGAIAGVGAVGSAVIGSKAASNAAKTSQQAADQSAALQRETYQNNAATLAPYVQTGNAAGAQINALLGLQTAPQPQQQFAQPNALMQPNATGGGFGGIIDRFGSAMAGTNQQQSGPNFAGYVNSNPDLMAEFQRVGDQFGGDPAAYGQYHWQTYGQNEGRTVPAFGSATGVNPATGATPSLTPQQTAQNAFDQYRNSTGYQFRLSEGMNALNSGYAGAGTIKSGAAMKGITEYGQNFASNEFGNYMNALGNQQGVGFSAAAAQSGVGTNYANSMANINQSNAANQANAGLVRASTIGQGVAGVANALGTVLGPSTNYAAGMPTAAQINTNTLASLRGY